MSKENFLKNIEAYGENADEVAEAYAENLYAVSEYLDLDIDLSMASPFEIHVGDAEENTGDYFVKLSNPEQYREDMQDDFEIVEDISSMSVDYPVHEVAESSGHLAAELSVSGRRKNSGRDTVVNEFFGGLGLGINSLSLLENDRVILERNLRLQEDFFSEEQLRHVQENLDEYRSIAEDLWVRFENQDVAEFREGVHALHEDLMGDAPATLDDFDEYSWSHNYDVGTFSEYFIETYVIPGGGNIRQLEQDVFESRETLQNDIEKKNNALEAIDRKEVEKIKDHVYAKGSENNRAYLTARILAQKALNGDSLDASELVHMDNTEVWRRISTDASWINRELHEQHDIPQISEGKSSGRTSGPKEAET